MRNRLDAAESPGLDRAPASRHAAPRATASSLAATARRTSGSTPATRPASRAAAWSPSPSDVSTCSLTGDLDLLARHDVAGLGVDRLERQRRSGCRAIQSTRRPAPSAVRAAQSRARSMRVTRSSGARCIRRSVSRTRSSGNTCRNGDCSSATASATLSAPSKTGSPVVFMKSARTMVSWSVSVRDPRRTNNDDSAARRITSAVSAAAATHGPSRRRFRSERPPRQARGHRRRRRRTIARIRRERLQDHAFELRVDVGHERRRTRRQTRPARAVVSRPDSDDQLVQHHAQRVQVGLFRQRTHPVRAARAPGSRAHRPTRRSPSARVANPNSTIRTEPSSSMSTLPGLRSR